MLQTSPSGRDKGKKDYENGGKLKKKTDLHICVKSQFLNFHRIFFGSYKILCHEDGTTVIDFRLLLALLSPTANLGVEAVPLTTRLPR
jgi:hypothetical protein